jgi:anti-repressor protein
MLLRELDHEIEWGSRLHPQKVILDRFIPWLEFNFPIQRPEPVDYMPVEPEVMDEEDYDEYGPATSTPFTPVDINGLVPIYAGKVGEDETNAVDARALHEKLGVGSRFNDWIGNRIKDCNFSEGQDFIAVTKNLVNGGRSKEYWLTLDAAKHIAMMERNDQGKLIRQYFIDFEKTAREVLPEKTFDQMVTEVVEGLRQRNIEQQKVIDQQAPRVELADRFLSSDEWMTASHAAKALWDDHGIRVGRNTLLEILRYPDLQVLMSNNEPYQRHVRAGRFKMGFKPRKNSNCIDSYLQISRKGFAYIFKLLQKLGYENERPNQAA